MAVAAGGAFWIKAISQEKASYRVEEVGSQWEAYEAPRTATRAHIAAGIGGGLVTAGLINWLFFDEDDSAQTALIFTPSTTTLSVGGTW